MCKSSYKMSLLTGHAALCFVLILKFISKNNGYLDRNQPFTFYIEYLPWNPNSIDSAGERAFKSIFKIYDFIWDISFKNDR